MPNSESLLKAIDPTAFCVQAPTWSFSSDSYCFLHYCSLLESGNIYFSVRFNGESAVSVSLICHLEERRGKNQNYSINFTLLFPLKRQTIGQMPYKCHHLHLLIL